MCAQKILLAEHDGDQEDLLLLAFEAASIDADVVVLRDGEAVLEYFLPRRTGRAVNTFGDLLLLDRDLPKLEGLTVLRQLQWLHRADLSRLPPIVILSDSDEPSLAASAYHFGASGFLCQRSDVQSYVRAVEQTVRYWLGASPRSGRAADRTSLTVGTRGARGRHLTAPK